MNVRLRLIIGSLLVAFFVLVVFGTVAYRIALQSGTSSELKLLEHNTSVYAEHLHDIKGPGTKLAELTEHIHVGEQSFAAAIYMNADRRFHLLKNDVEIDLADLNLTAIAEKDARSGKLTVGGHELLWIHAPLDKGPEQLLMLFDTDRQQNAVAKSLAIKFIVTAAFTIWLSVWIALIVAKRIVHQIDTKNQAIMHQALHDPLTGLPNRSHLINSLEQLASGKTAKRRYLFGVLDLNNFKDINDALGHDAGDEILRKAAERIVESHPQAELIARIGGDVFAIAISDQHCPDYQDLINGLQATFEQPFSIGGLDLVITTTIGAAIYPDHATQPDALIKHAEIAMIQAKQSRKAALLYTPAEDPSTIRRLALINELGSAISDGQMVLYYQPKIDINTRKTVAVEALVRWNHPQHGMIPPMEFIELAEKSLLIDQLTLWVIEEAVRQCRVWLDMGIELGVAVNLSVQNLYDMGLSKQIQASLDRWRVPAGLLKLEITEGAIMADPDTALQNLNDLNAMGLQLSIDDFGTGYSSLAYLKKLPVGELKIDRAFVKDMVTDEDDATIVRSTVELAHNLAYSVVAEGIEDEPTLALLQQLSCDVAQGFYFSRPLPAEEFEEWLKHTEWQNQIKQ